MGYGKTLHVCTTPLPWLQINYNLVVTIVSYVVIPTETNTRKCNVRPQQSIDAIVVSYFLPGVLIHPSPCKSGSKGFPIHCGLLWFLLFSSSIIYEMTLHVVVYTVKYSLISCKFTVICLYTMAPS